MTARLYTNDWELLWSSDTGTQEELDALVLAQTPQYRTIVMSCWTRFSQRVEYTEHGGSAFRDETKHFEKLLIEPDDHRTEGN